MQSQSSIPSARRHQRILYLLACVISLPACNGAKTDVTKPDIPYTTLISKYNTRANHIKQIWARTVIEFQWTDKDKKKHSEQGSGTLMLRKPLDLALPINKLGTPLLWLGSDKNRFWLFELKPPKDQPTRVYVGTHAEAGKTSRRILSIPTQPDQLIQLLGITPLPSHSSDLQYVVDKTSKNLVVTIPIKDSPLKLSRRITIDPTTLLPIQIQFIDANMKVTTTALLSEFKPLQVKGLPFGSLPKIPTRIAISVTATGDSLKLHLSDQYDGIDPPRIRDFQFDFDRLKEFHEPEKTHYLFKAPK